MSIPLVIDGLEPEGMGGVEGPGVSTAKAAPSLTLLLNVKQFA
jgi:hypothetical protein